MNRTEAVNIIALVNDDTPKIIEKAVAEEKFTVIKKSIKRNRL